MSNVVLFHQCSTIKVDVSMDPLIRLQICRRSVHFTASFILRETRAVHTFQEIQIPSQVQIQTYTFQEIKMPSPLQIQTHNFQEIQMPSQLQIETDNFQEIQGPSKLQIQTTPFKKYKYKVMCKYRNKKSRVQTSVFQTF